MKPQATLRFASVFASNLAAPIRLTNALAVLFARSAGLGTVLACAAVLATVAHPSHAAAVTEAWVHRYSNVVSNSAELLPAKVVRDATGDIIVAGTIDDHITGADMLTIKYSGADGRVLWQKRYDGPAKSNDEAHAVALDGSGNVFVTGSSIGSEGYSDFYTAKYAAVDGTVLWEKRYNGPENNDDASNAVAVDSSGNVVVTGYSSGSGAADYYTAKYAAADGALLWEKRYNGPVAVGSTDQAQAVAVDGSGNVVVTGSSSGSGIADYYTAKYAAADGALLWEKRYNGPANWYDHATALAVDGNGNVVVTGISYHNGNSDGADYYTAKYAAADGVLLWEKRYNGPTNREDIALVVAVDGNGNVVVTGYSAGSGTSRDFYTAKYAGADGELLWEKRYNGLANHEDYATALALDGNGNVVVTGSSSGSGIADYYTAKYAAANGALLWERRYNGPANGNDVAHAVAVDGSGNVVVTGSSANGVGTYNKDYYTVKYAGADGIVLWEQRSNGPANSHGSATAVAVDGSGNVVVTGRSANGERDIPFGFPIFDYYTAKYAVANGALLWEQRYNSPANGNDDAQAVAVDGSGNVVVTGYSSVSGGDFDCYTAKYASANGALLWEKRSNGRGQAVAGDGSGDVVVTGFSGTAKYAAADGALLWEKRSNGGGQAMAVDGSGNAVVTGYSHNGTGNDYYTAKYAAADGALLWEKRYNGPANKDDEAQAVAVDGNGNVVVTGLSGNAPPKYGIDYYTAKYAAADGALLWEKRYNGPANNDDHASAVAVDGSGNVVVTGFSYSTNSYPDYYTAKYAAADGALLWEKRYNGPADADDRAQAVAVDGSGNVVVTGTSRNRDDYGDYYTAKYAAADGALLWEKRYNGPANGSEYVPSLRSLALGPNGMVVVTGSSDGNFGPGTTFDYATVVYRESVSLVSIELVPTGVRLRFAGDPGRTYTIERALAVTGPWAAINTPTAPTGGFIEHVDTTSPAGTAFYRTSTP